MASPKMFEKKIELVKDRPTDLLTREDFDEVRTERCVSFCVYYKDFDMVIETLVAGMTKYRRGVSECLHVHQTPDGPWLEGHVTAHGTRPMTEDEARKKDTFDQTKARVKELLASDPEVAKKALREAGVQVR